MVIFGNGRRIRQLEERLSKLERENTAYDYTGCPAPYSLPTYIEVTPAKLYARIKEIYDYLGVERVTQPMLTKLKKKQ